MKFAILALVAVVAADYKSMHEKLMEEIAKQEKLHPSGNGFFDKEKKEKEEEEKEKKLIMLRQFDAAIDPKAFDDVDANGNVIRNAQDKAVQ